MASGNSTQGRRLPNLPLPRRSEYSLTSSSPRTLSLETCGLTPKHILFIRKVDGEDAEFILTSPVAKIIAVESSNIRLRLRARLLASTLELVRLTNFHVIVDFDPSPPLATPTAGPGADSDTKETDLRPALIGTVQLDPPLKEVSITYLQPVLGSHVFAPKLDSLYAIVTEGADEIGAQTGYEDVKLIVEGDATSDIASASASPGTLVVGYPSGRQIDGSPHNPLLREAVKEQVVPKPDQSGTKRVELEEQYVATYTTSKGWEVASVQRKERGYPMLTETKASTKKSDGQNSVNILEAAARKIADQLPPPASRR